MNHHASQDFWQCCSALPPSVRELADKSVDLLKANPAHASLHFKKVGRIWSARVGLRYCAVAVEALDGLA